MATDAIRFDLVPQRFFARNPVLDGQALPGRGDAARCVGGMPAIRHFLR